MNLFRSLLWTLGAAILLAQSTFATPKSNFNISRAPSPTPCIKSAFSATGDQWWKNIILQLTNNCGTAVDFQNASVTFKNGIQLNTSFWGDFGPLSYPDNELKFNSQLQSDGKYLINFSLHFPTYPGANSKLPAGSSIFIKYGASSEAHVEGTTMVYLQGPTDSTGTIELNNVTAKPANVTQTYALVHVTMNGQKISDVQVPWNGKQTLPNLAVGSYNIAADNVTDTTGKSYQAQVVPPTVNVTANQTAQVNISYSEVTPSLGKVAINLQPKPSELATYTGTPSASVIDASTGNAVAANLSWGAATTVSNLKNGSTYRFSTPTITHNSFTCVPSFNPTTLVAADPAPTTNLTYSCSQAAQSRVTLNVTGAPNTLPSLKITLTPNNSTPAVSQTVTLSNGSGTSVIMLPTGTVYNVSADPVSGYNLSFNPQPLTASDNAIETIALSPVGTGTPVQINGQLSVCGTKLCNQHGTPIQLKGMSSHGLQWYGWGKCLTAASLDALANNFKASVFRISMYIQEGGYETNPAAFTQQVNTLIEEATRRGMYVIVDWHMLTPGDPNYNLSRAKTFFTAIANAHKTKVNIIYEIANEPNGVNWATIKSYADQLIPVIRAIDTKNVILVGTVAWSSLGVSDGRTSQDIISNPVNFPNIMYTFHFYAASHRDNYLNELDRASNVLPIFVTEFGTQTYSGDGGNDFAMSDRYMQLMATKKISWTNWNYSDDFRSGAIWQTGTCPNGPWTDSRLKPAGAYIKAKIQA